MTQFSDGFGNMRKSSAAIYRIARHQFHPGSLFIGEDAIAVVLLFVDPSMMMERLAHERGKHGPNSKWNTSLQNDS